MAMVNNEENIIAALKELELFSDSINCLKSLKDTSILDNSLIINLLKFLIYLSLRQHILIEGSIPEKYRVQCSSIQTTSIQDMFCNAPVRISFYQLSVFICNLMNIHCLLLFAEFTGVYRKIEGRLDSQSKF